jgi:hypothetical protein
LFWNKRPCEAEIYEWHAKQKQEELKLDRRIEEIGIDEIAMHKDIMILF